MQFETIRDFKRAGRSLALLATDTMAATLQETAELRPEALTEDLVDGLLANHIEVLDETVAGFIAAGVPARWAMKFRLAFLDTARKRMADHNLAALAPAGAG